MTGGLNTKHAALVAAVAAGVVVFFTGASAHLKRTCVVMDTPYLPICPSEAQAAGDRRTQLQERLARNPGDSAAWLDLLQASGPSADGVLRANAAVAPSNANVLRWSAARDLEQGRLEQGVATLVRLLQYRSAPREARVLAALIARGDGVALLQRHVGEGKNWLPQVLSAMAGLKVPPGQALPLVAAALEKDALPPEVRQAYMRSLKGSGQWLDAYGLWMAEHKQVPLLYNSGFDDPFAADGFDWEFTPAPRSRAGNFLEQVAVARRGYVLDIEFTGRSFTAPALWQYVFTPPGAYRLRGEYSATNLKSESGLAWSVQCMGGGQAVPGRSPPLHDTGGVWKPFELVFATPADCGPVTRIQLGPVAGYEALSGLKGRVSFDNFSLAPAPRP